MVWQEVYVYISSYTMQIQGQYLKQTTAVSSHIFSSYSFIIILSNVSQALFLCIE
jgi:hypothetical protein